MGPSRHSRPKLNGSGSGGQRLSLGAVYTVRYEAVNGMLLNEFLKEHRKVEEQGRKLQDQESAIAQQQKETKSLTASLKEQASQIQKVSDQLEVSKAAPRMVLNNQ